MNALFRYGLVTFALTLLAVGPANAEACNAGTISFSEDLNRAVMEPALKKAQAAVSTQVAAPSAAKAGTSIVDRATFPSLLGMAVESGLIKSDNNVTTLNLNLFAFLSMARPQVVFSQEEYQKHELLRRFGGTASFGGKGLKFDRNGDGTADEPLEAKELGDIVTWEVQVRPSKSRDPREYYNVNVIASSLSAPHLDFSGKQTRFLQDHFAEIRAMMDPNKAGCVDEFVWKSFLGRSEIAAEIADIGAAAKAVLDARTDTLKDLTGRLVWNLFVGGVERKPQFGPNSIRAGARLDWRKNTFNLEWMRTDSLVGTEKPESLKGGLKYTTKWLKGSLTPEGVDVSASGSYEVFRNDPDAKHDTTAKLNVAFEYPIATGMKIPVSVTWANHADLLTGEKDIRGHIGLTIDFSKLAKATTK
jgi:hypothetical protein